MIACIHAHLERQRLDRRSELGFLTDVNSLHRFYGCNRSRRGGFAAVTSVGCQSFGVHWE